LLSGPSAATKEALPLLKLGRFGDRRSARNSLRHDGNMMVITGIEGDHDAGTMTLDQAAERLTAAGITAILYTTPSHSPVRPRWRVLCPTSEPWIGERPSLAV
jgi:hypothetical protein